MYVTLIFSQICILLMWTSSISKILHEMGGRENSVSFFFFFFWSVKRTCCSFLLFGWTVFPADAIRPPPTVSFYCRHWVYSESTQRMKISNLVNGKCSKSSLYKTASAHWSLTSSHVVVVKPFSPVETAFPIVLQGFPCRLWRRVLSDGKSLAQVPLESSLTGVKVIGIYCLWGGNEVPWYRTQRKCSFEFPREH